MYVFICIFNILLAQVLAASKNKISTLKGFPYLPVLEVGFPLNMRGCYNINWVFYISSVIEIFVIKFTRLVGNSVVGYGTNLGLSICITVYFLQREKLHSERSFISVIFHN